jgi:hypothetical protein
MASDLNKARQESARKDLYRISKMSENELAYEPKVKQIKDTLRVNIKKQQS